MKVLFDNNVDWRFARHIEGHQVLSAYKRGWASLSNGKLLAAAEEDGFDVLITADKNMHFQLNMTGRRISVIVLGARFTDYKGIAPLADRVLSALQNVVPGSIVVVV